MVDTKKPKQIGRHSYNVNNVNVLYWGISDYDAYIGNFCSIAENCNIIVGGGHRTDWITTFPFPCLDPWNRFVKEPSVRDAQPSKGDVHIGNDVWIGMNSTIMSGVTIGDGAVLAANSHVFKNVPPYAIVGGNPARIIAMRFDDETIDGLLRLKWWDWSDQKILDNTRLLCSNDVEKLLALNKDAIRESHGKVPEKPPVIHSQDSQPPGIEVPMEGMMAMGAAASSPPWPPIDVGPVGPEPGIAHTSHTQPVAQVAPVAQMPGHLMSIEEENPIVATPKVVANSNLVYYSLSGGQVYVDMLILSLKTIEKCTPINSIDFLVITDKKTKVLIDSGLMSNNMDNFRIDFMVVDDIKYGVEASMKKLDIFKYKSFNLYRNILYLDVDIIIVNSLLPVFEQCIHDDKLYVFPESGCDIDGNLSDCGPLHKEIFWSLKDYTKNELEFMSLHKIPVFCAGHFMFKGTETMRTHFKNVFEMYTNHLGITPTKRTGFELNKVTFFYEQSYMNKYFNLRNMTECMPLRKYVSLPYANFEENRRVFDTTIIIHIANEGLPPDKKYECMMQFFKQFRSAVGKN